jgi:hypothetical protein
MKRPMTGPTAAMTPEYLGAAAFSIWISFLQTLSSEPTAATFIMPPAARKLP